MLKQFNTPVSQLGEKEQKEAVDEVRFLATLEHPNIIRCVRRRELVWPLRLRSLLAALPRYFDHWLENDVLVIVLEFADAGTLASVIAKGGYDDRQIWLWFLQLLSSLEYLHDQKIIHRDLKSANVLMKGLPRLSDVLRCAVCD